MYVDYDYDQKTDYNQFRTYAFDLGEDGSGLSDFDERRFIKYSDSILQGKGLAFSENPDIWITLAAEEYETQSRNTLGVGLGGGGGGLGVGVSGGIPIGGAELRQRIQVNFVQSTTNAVIWEATSESDLKAKSKPAQRDAHFQKLTTRIFKKYPPEQN